MTLETMNAASLCDQHCIILSTLHDIINAALHPQRCSVLSTLHHTVNDALENGADTLLNSLTKCKVLFLNPWILSNYYLHRISELTTLVKHFERFSKSGIKIYNSEVPDTAGKKTRRRRRRRTQAFGNLKTFLTNAIN